MRAEQERLVYDKDQESQRKCEKLQQQLESIRRQEERKLQDELALKNERIKELERTEMRKNSEKELNESLGKQLKEVQEYAKSMKAERDLMSQDRQYLEDALKKAKDQLKGGH
jgi:hypothetical protein